MSGNQKKIDPRIIRTNSALMQALPALLEQRSFKRITVNDLCQEAQISRAAFYSHFKDKYDLLREYLIEQHRRFLRENAGKPDIYANINKYIRRNDRLISNILQDQDDEVSELVMGFIAQTIGMSTDHASSDQSKVKQTILANFISGGTLNLLMWQKKHKFPHETELANPYLANILTVLKSMH